MQDEALGVADVCQVREEVDGVDDLHRRVVAAFHAEHHHAAEAVLQVARGKRV